MKWHIYWHIYPSRSASGSEWQFKIVTVQAHSGRSTGNLRFLLFKLIVADQLADLPTLTELPLVVASSGQEWQLNISTVGRSTPPPN